MTAEVCPHHFILTSDDIKRDDPNYKMNPPLRTPKDVEALKQGLKDGTIEVISTDHAPHSAQEKTGSMKNAPFGIVGLETSLPLTYTELVEKDVITLKQMVEKMCLNPAKILGLDRGTLQKGHPADVIIVDTEEYAIDKNKFVSKGHNTPFDGWKVKGKVLYTICDGKIVFNNQEEERKTYDQQTDCKNQKTKRPIVVGLDPMLNYIPEHIQKKAFAEFGETLEGAAEAIWQYNKGIVDATCDLIPAVKPQIAMYEQFGIPGLIAYKKTVEYCKSKDLVVIGDIKRG